MPHFTKGDVTIRYEEVGSGFPLLATPGGGLNSKLENCPARSSTPWRSSRTTSA